MEAVVLKYVDFGPAAEALLDGNDRWACKAFVDRYNSHVSDLVLLSARGITSPSDVVLAMEAAGQMHKCVCRVRDLFMNYMVGFRGKLDHKVYGRFKRLYDAYTRGMHFYSEPVMEGHVDLGLVTGIVVGKGGLEGDHDFVFEYSTPGGDRLEPHYLGEILDFISAMCDYMGMLAGLVNGEVLRQNGADMFDF